MKMYNGALADLNGRHHLSQHLEECFPAINLDHFLLSPCWMFNGFMPVNDTNGRGDEGRALKMIASVLKQVGVQRGPFWLTMPVMNFVSSRIKEC